MRRFRPLARALAWLWPLVATGCLQDAPSAPGAGGSPLRIQAQLGAAQAEQLLRVRAFYVEGATPVDLPVSPNEIRVTSGSSATHNVSVRLAPCFAAFAGAPTTGCRLTVEVSLVDAAGEMLSRAQQSVLVVNGSDPVTVPPFVLAQPAVGLSAGTLAFTADQGGSLPAALTVTATSSTGAALGTLSVAVASATPDLLTATVDQATGVITLRPTATTLAPGTYTATVTVSSSREGIVPAPITVSFVVRPSGVIAGVVRDAATNAAIAGAQVALYNGTTATGTPINTVTTGASGVYRFEQLAAGTYTLGFTAGGYTSETRSPVTVTAATTTTVNVGLTRPGGTLVGTLRNAVTEAAIPGATVSLYAGTAATGTPVATTTTSATGTYRFEAVLPGTYTVSAAATGFIAASAGPVTVATGATSAADIVASPVLPAGQTRIVLTWGANPGDLDSHLFGPSAANFYHLYYGAPDHTPYAVLDLDDTNGHGPETVTIMQQPAGKHTYMVHHFAGSGSIATSGARVSVYRGNALVAEFTPPNQAGTLWTVFELDGNTIVPVNRITDDNPANVRPGLGRTAPAGPSLHRTAPLKQPPVVRP